MGKIADITGKKFGFLVVLELASRKCDASGKMLPPSWMCLCEKCGNTVEIPAAQLRNSSNRTSCGCMKKEAVPPAAKKTVMPGENNTLRKWGPCPYPSDSCSKSKQGWCCADCNDKSCLDRCQNTPGRNKLKHCGCEMLKRIVKGVR